MKTAFQIDLTFDQILSIIRQLSSHEKLKLAEELEKEVFDRKLSLLLKTFKTDDLDQNTIDEEIENVRQELYEKQKR